jgi:hypothetical protein
MVRLHFSCMRLLLLSPVVAVFGPVAVLLVHSLLDLLTHSSLADGIDARA